MNIRACAWLISSSTLALLAGCSSQPLTSNSQLPFTSNSGKTCPHPETLQTRVFARELLTGSWQGVKAFAEGGRYQWITHHYADGTYRSVFREPNEKTSTGTKDKVEVGFWGVSGMVRYMIFRGWETPKGFMAAPPDEPSYYDAFLLEHIDEQHMQYCNLETGERYKAVRVELGTEFPVAE